MIHTRVLWSFLKENPKVINIVVPMAGAGSRFSSAGYKEPKPFIEIFGKPMIQWVIENLTTNFEHQFIFICQEKHVFEFHFDTILKEICPNSHVVCINGLTQGAAETVLYASEMIDNRDPLVIANSDQYIEYKLEDFYESVATGDSDGSILTMTSSSPKWSYVKYGEDLQVIEVREKEVISDEATVGIYGFSRGEDFVRSARRMIEKDLRVNGEFYVAPVYNELIQEGHRIKFENIGSDANQMNGLGTPEDLELFIQKARK
jgi:NDP-sugar pyrophosphorylase family protein